MCNGEIQNISGLVLEVPLNLSPPPAILNCEQRDAPAVIKCPAIHYIHSAESWILCKGQGLLLLPAQREKVLF